MTKKEHKAKIKTIKTSLVAVEKELKKTSEQQSQQSWLRAVSIELLHRMKLARTQDSALKNSQTFKTEFDAESATLVGLDKKISEIAATRNTQFGKLVEIQSALKAAILAAQADGVKV